MDESKHLCLYALYRCTCDQPDSLPCFSHLCVWSQIGHPQGLGIQRHRPKLLLPYGWASQEPERSRGPLLHCLLKLGMTQCFGRHQVLAQVTCFHGLVKMGRKRPGLLR